MLIAALSDTHLPDAAHALPTALVERLAAVDLILHAGDFASTEAMNYIATFAPLEAVHGNVDEVALMASLPRTRIVDVGPYRIGLVHGDGLGSSTLQRARQAFRNVDCIVFGHSHDPYLKQHGSVLLLNPGSPTDKRRAPRPSFALIRVDDRIDAEIVYL